MNAGLRQQAGKLSFLLTVAIVAAILAPTTACGGILYSVDFLNHDLVTIDSNTGEVTIIGAVDNSLSIGALTSFDDRLIALNLKPGIRADILEIDPLTGAIITSAQVSTASGNVRLAESITDVNGQIIIGFREPGLFNSSVSNVLGNISLSSGLIADIRTASGAGADFDGIASADGGGTLYNADHDPMYGTYFESIGTPTALDYDVNSLFDVLNLRTFDIEFNNGVLFGINNTHVLTVNLSTNQVSSKTLSRAGSYNSIALAQTAAVPEPSSLLLLASGMCLVLWRRKS